MNEPTQCLRQSDLIERLGVSISTLRRWIAEDKFPAPIRVDRALLWREQTVLDWLAKQEQNDES